jgi:hypothetical protein
VNCAIRDAETTRPPPPETEADRLRRLASDKRVMMAQLGREAVDLERAATRLDVEKRTRQRFYP